MSTATRMQSGEADNWPWQQLLSPGVLKQWLCSEEETTGRRRVPTGAPPALLAMLRSLGDFGLAEEWCELLEVWCGEPIRFGLVLRTKDDLLDLGYRYDLVGALVVALSAAYITRQVKTKIYFEPPVSKLALNVALSVLSGLTGEPDESTITWLLEYAVAHGSTDATGLLQNLTDAKCGDSTAQRVIVSLVVPYWDTLATVDLLGRWDEKPEMLGFPYLYAMEIKDQPAVLVLRARLLFINGHAGDEETAVQLAVEAALGGSQHAWNLLNDWRLNGYDDLVLQYLLSVGSLRHSGSECVSSPDE